MSASLIINTNIYTPVGNSAAHGADMSAIRHIPNGEIEIQDGEIVYAGPAREHDTRLLSSTLVIDADGRATVPGFVDSHTHLVFGGFRPEEFMWRMRGDSYMDIMNRGGGIANTTKATRSTGIESLTMKTLAFLNTMSEMGITTVEAKSGYGLDLDTELKQLRVISRINELPQAKVDVVPTFLGAHAVPPEYKGRTDEYVDFIIAEVLPKVKQSHLSDICDVFCEKGVFSVEQSHRLLSAAADMGYSLKLHADEIVDTGGASLAAELGALSADHLLHASDEGIKALANSNTIATLLPITAFTLREPFARARKMIDEGCAVALASDINPGSCCSCSVPLIFALACIYMHMSVEEALTAITLNGAAALGLASRIGTIEEGKVADIVMLNSNTIHSLPYYTAMNLVALTMKRGDIVTQNNTVRI